MIRSSKHYFKEANNNKKSIVADFLEQYRFATQQYIDYIWTNQIYNQHKEICFDLQQDKLDLPPYLNYQAVKFETKLSARALSAASNQAIGLVKGQVAIRKKLLWVIQQRQLKNQNIEYYQKKLNKVVLIKPILKDNFQAELSSKNIKLVGQDKKKYFDLFVKLQSTGYDITYLPVSFHSGSNKWMKKKSSKLLGGILLSKNYVQLRWEVVDVPKKKRGKVVGADTGLKTIVSLSNQQTTPKTDKHGHSFESILQKLSKKKKGSKNFLQTQQHRRNFINWSLNQLNFKGIKEIKLEEIVNIFSGRNTSRYMKGFTNSIIEKKIISLGEEAGVLISLQPSTYKSQRCSSCGMVRKANRKGKEYHCNNCKLVIDADLNSAINNEKNLFKIPYGFRQLKLNRKGFFWRQEGLFGLTGEEIRVPHIVKNE
jgi:transposase